MSELDGYIKLRASQVVEYCEKTIERVNTVQKKADQEFKDWAIPYYNQLCRQKWYQFWRSPKFKDLKDFNKWFLKMKWGSFCFKLWDFGGEEAKKSFSKKSEWFERVGKRISWWYPCSWGSEERSISEALLPKAKKLYANKEMFISVEDFGYITLGLKDGELVY